MDGDSKEYPREGTVWRYKDGDRNVLYVVVGCEVEFDRILIEVIRESPNHPAKCSMRYADSLEVFHNKFCRVSFSLSPAKSWTEGNLHEDLFNANFKGRL